MRDKLVFGIVGVGLYLVSSLYYDDLLIIGIIAIISIIPLSVYMVIGSIREYSESLKNEALRKEFGEDLTKVVSHIESLEERFGQSLLEGDR